MERPYSYFVSDVHLGLAVGSPSERERRFVEFLRSINPAETENLFLLGDIWDFWYEYRDVVPKGYARVFAAFQDLIDSGVRIYFFQGNHDVWTYSYLEELGLTRLVQPSVVQIAGKKFCLGHGDGLGPVPLSYKFLRSVFHCRALQFLFSLLHPWIAFRLGNGWSRHNRLSRKERGGQYVFDAETCPLVPFSESFLRKEDVDYFVFGHYHVSVDYPLNGAARLIILKDWIDEPCYLRFDATLLSNEVLGGYSQKSE